MRRGLRELVEEEGREGNDTCYRVGRRADGARLGGRGKGREQRKDPEEREGMKEKRGQYGEGLPWAFHTCRYNDFSRHLCWGGITVPILWMRN